MRRLTVPATVLLLAGALGCQEKRSEMRYYSAFDVWGQYRATMEQPGGYRMYEPKLGTMDLGGLRVQPLPRQPSVDQYRKVTPFGAGVKVQSSP